MTFVQFCLCGFPLFLFPPIPSICFFIEPVLCVCVCMSEVGTPSFSSSTEGRRRRRREEEDQLRDTHSLDSCFQAVLCCEAPHQQSRECDTDSKNNRVKNVVQVPRAIYTYKRVFMILPNMKNRHI